MLSHGGPSAYPPDRSQTFFSSALGYTWSNSSVDEIMTRAIRKNADNLQAAALKEGQNVAHVVVYPNYSLLDTLLKDMYGNNVNRLGKLKRTIDHKNIMGLAGGFKCGSMSENPTSWLLCDKDIGHYISKL
ncbi:hypothetical protein B0F90DRAFT_293546 [Multifurca ochricompacta]|uniref:Uncharacterized protein n=1 Tax=Multifurca ochricompacta TaxID=376703 RepID=A0AAD4QMN8_9AGAM|nr:hypothetical protein B0F90DRAFT_293546 [Multifurca ochricompacta]